MAKPRPRKKRCPVCKGPGTVGGGLLPSVCCGYCKGRGFVMRLKGYDLSPSTEALGVPEILEEMAQTFRERNKQYGDNWKMVGQVMAVLFPTGVQLRTAEDYDVWHLFELKIVKLTRFAIGRLEHIDSIHDDAVYSAMIEAILKLRKEKRA